MFVDTVHRHRGVSGGINRTGWRLPLLSARVLLTLQHARTKFVMIGRRKLRYVGRIAPVKNVRFGWKNAKSHVGIAQAVGPCKCSEIGVCSCRITEDNNLSSTEKSFQNDTKEKQPFPQGEPSPHSQNPDWCGQLCIILGPVLLLGLCISIILVIVFLRKRRVLQLPVICAGIKSRNFIELEGAFDSISSDYLSDDFITWKRAARVVHDSRWEFSRNNLIFDKVLGEGEYGRVLRAQALNIRGHTGYTPVAVKMMKTTASPSEVQDFVRELELLKQVNHPNVIRLLGAVTTKGPFLVIVEYCEHGALRSFLRANRKRAPVFNENHDSLLNATPVNIGRHELVSYAWQICRGMYYLSCLKFVHRDLAARNILVTSDYVMKISDFGLSRDIYEEETYVKKGKGRIPVKWMAVEVLYDNICTSKSDVWSFGVLLWEMMTMGSS
ncbi:Proto-oncogene tyrosine-protein kinase receptor Ret [Holothuria leucospilota]|uniref:Proto-oncogene tyrosine-protein kinase receptor Ret n=1 Tax=Holothuria leucospilota TaxID=206669 RepID=A0A9Q0YIN6_HOLLE|nr:Proto-oncogene tyrosine-protein kinase receptor Ret [Holothuria leucospilota]